MTTRVYQTLFLCTGNSARSILAEAILDRLGGGRIQASSAGSQPAGRVHPLALRVLEKHGYDLSGLQSKSWDEFSKPGAPEFDFVITVCDNAARAATQGVESNAATGSAQVAAGACPIWPTHAITAHWGLPDPARFTGPEDEHLEQFERAYRQLEHRIGLFTKLAFEDLDRAALQARLRSIHESAASEEEDDR